VTTASNGVGEPEHGEHAARLIAVRHRGHPGAPPLGAQRAQQRDRGRVPLPPHERVVGERSS
jgi:hypothetical protein